MLRIFRNGDSPIKKSEKDIKDIVVDMLHYFLKCDYRNSAKCIQQLIKYSYFEADLSFIGFYLTQIMSLDDYYTKIICFRACSLFLYPSSPAVEMIPSILRKSFRYTELVNHSLHTLSYVVNPSIFLSLKDDLAVLSDTINDTGRKTILHIYYKVTIVDETALDSLISLLEVSILIPSLKYTSCAVICELCEMHKEKLSVLLPTIISDFSICSYSVFTKISRILIRMGPYSPDVLSSIEKSLSLLINRQESSLFFIDFALIAKKLQLSSQIFSYIGKKLETMLIEEKDINVIGEVLNSLYILIPEYKPETSIISPFLEFNEPKIKGISLTIWATASKDKKQSLSALFNFTVETRSRSFAQKLLSFLKPEGKVFTKILFGLYDSQIPLFDDLIAVSIISVIDDTTRKSILKAIRNRIFTLPDSIFGCALASIISEWSNSPDLFHLLLPPNFSHLSEVTQNAFIDSAAVFWIKNPFEANEGLKNRLHLIVQSQYSGVRQRASELISMICQ